MRLSTYELATSFLLRLTSFFIQLKVGKHFSDETQELTLCRRLISKTAAADPTYVQGDHSGQLQPPIE